MNLTKRCFLLLGLALSYELVGAQDNELWMIVGIHGTVGARVNASLDNVCRIMMDDVEHSNYDKAVNLIRSNPYIFQNQLIQDYGLKYVNLCDQKPGNAAALFCDLYEQILKTVDPKPALYRFYTFGWSGVLSESIRYKSAHRLYHELLDEYLRLKKEHPTQTIKICIIGYSHGGTVSLNLAHVLEKERPGELPPIDLLVLLGVPVQAETAFHVMSPLFKRVYHIYSREDHVQKMDFLSFKRFFSLRRFSDSSQFVAPGKITQIELKIKVPQRRYKPGKRVHYHDRSPGHIELWFFGWENNSYRERFPLHPLPTAMLIPSLITAAEKTMPHETDLVMDVYPSCNKIDVRKRGYYKKETTTFLEPELLDQLRQKACDARPECFKCDDYQSQIQSCVKQAYGSISEKQRGRACRCTA